MTPEAQFARGRTLPPDLSLLAFEDRMPLPMLSPLPVANGADARHDVVASLARRLPDELRPLADLAFNYRWSWDPRGAQVFEDLDPEGWARAEHNPVRQLVQTRPEALERAAADRLLLERIGDVVATVNADLQRPFADGFSADAPIAFLCAEYGLHRSLPVYSGGLGVLAGDILKEASDLALPMVAVGLMYRHGYFHQRIDAGGWQHEYWTEANPRLLPITRVTDQDGDPLAVDVPVWDRDVRLHVWRVDVGRVPLFLLDADVAGNNPVDRWITGRLYETNRDLRLAQYAVLGIGGIRALHALGLTPGVVHLNEGHAALGALELAAADVAHGHPFERAQTQARQRVVFTTHTPVSAGNETYHPNQILDVLAALPQRLGTDEAGLLRLGRVDPDNDHAEAGMTPMALRLSRHVNAVSQRHGEVARGMWSGLFQVEPDEVPIRHVTNGVHLPTWMAPPIRALLDRHLDPGWTRRAANPQTWEPVDAIPDAEVWAARCEAREELIAYVQDRVARDRLARGEDLAYLDRTLQGFDAQVLTVGFARRVAAYKRLYLLRRDPDRLLRLLGGPRPLQILFAGKAHPADDGAKGILRSMFELKGAPNVAERTAFLEDYDMASGAMLTMGCDVWINVPRPPLEASGTSGMKSALNGGLNLSVLDGWWDEAYDGDNGWAISGDVDHDAGAQDGRHADELYGLLEREVVPLFHNRNADGVPVAWVRRVKGALRTVGPRFCATRMMQDYARDVYTEPAARTSAS